MKIKYTVVYVALLLVGCRFGIPPSKAYGDEAKHPDNKADTVVGGITYKIVKQKKNIPDDDSPMGSWTIDKTYPVFQSSKNKRLAGMLNSAIKKTVQQFKCINGKGDETFNSQVSLLSANIFSMKYSAMWMCDVMPHPDSADGALNFNLKKMRMIVLKDEFINKRSYQTVTANILKKLNSKIQKISKANQANCPHADKLGWFIIDKDLITFSSPETSHVQSACQVSASVSRKSLAEYLKRGSVLR